MYYVGFLRRVQLKFKVSPIDACSKLSYLLFMLESAPEGRRHLHLRHLRLMPPPFGRAWLSHPRQSCFASSGEELGEEELASSSTTRVTFVQRNGEGGARVCSLTTGFIRSYDPRRACAGTSPRNAFW